MNNNMQNENNVEPTAITKSILMHYIASSEDSFFVNGSPHIETVEVVAYDNSWSEKYAKVALSIKNELGLNVQKIDHVGSTAVPGIAAKPWIDIDLTVADPTDEESYLPALENLGFKLIVREPRFHGHRLFHHENPRVNLHVLPQIVQKRPVICCFEIGFANHQKTVNYMPTQNLRQLKVAR